MRTTMMTSASSALLLVLILPVRAQDAPDSAPEIAWGGPVNGLQAGISLGRRIKGREHLIPLTAHLRSVGGGPVRILKLPERQKHYCALTFEVRSDGLLFKRPPFTVGIGPPPPPDAFVWLAPGETDSTDCTLWPEEWGIHTLSEAQVTFVFSNDNSETLASLTNQIGGPTTTVKGLWTGEARSGPIKVKIRSEQRKPRSTRRDLLLGAALTLVTVALFVALTVRRRKRVA